MDSGHKADNRHYTVSIVMCTYNGEKYLREQLDSIVNQTYPIKELLVQDDCSTDGTCDIVREYAQRYPYIRLIQNERQLGCNRNFYTAMQKADADFVAFSDQDDIWEPDKIAIQVETLTPPSDENSKVLCSGRSEQFTDDGSEIYNDTRKPNVNLFRMLYAAELPGHNIMVRRSFIPKIKFVTDGSYPFYHVWDMALPIAAAAQDGIVFIDKVLVHQRRNAKSLTYVSPTKSLPTAKNAKDMLLWCIKNYHQAQAAGNKVYENMYGFLERLDIDTPLRKEGMRLMRLQQHHNLKQLLQLEACLVRHRKEICHTRKPFPMDLVRALLFPLTSCYYWRMGIGQ